MSLGVILGIVPYMCVTSEELYRCVPLDFPYGFIYCIELIRSQGNMTYNQEQIYFSITYSLLKPLFLGRLFDWLYKCVFSISREIKQKPKRQDANALVLGRELLKASRKRYSVSGLWVNYIDVRSKIIPLKIRDRL